MMCMHNTTLLDMRKLRVNALFMQHKRVKMGRTGKQYNINHVSLASLLYLCHCSAIINAIFSKGNLIIVSLGAYLPPGTKRYYISSSIDYVA